LRSLSDHSRKNYYFDSALSPYVFVVDLNEINFVPGSGMRNSALEGEEGFKWQGVINDVFKPAQLILYLATEPKDA